MSRPNIQLALLAVPLFFSCGGGGGGATTPDGALETSFTALRKNDLSSLIDVVATPEEQEKMRADWEKQRKTAPSETEKAQFNSTMQMLTAPDAEEKLFAMVQPQLAQMKEQWAGLMGFVPMMTAGVAAENPGAQQTVQALAQKLAAVDIADEAKIKEAISIATKTAKKLGLENMDAVQKLSFDQLIGKGDVVLDGAKDILNIYGLDLDATLDSIEAKIVSEEGDTAKLEVSYSLFGAPEATTTVDMVKKDGRWAPKK